mmetsp:Transcript_46109/g.85880  ORF Transcript_46109/g.85880 Transcript_46109/m.85880 type:complete len:225 (+) Transcript_46109:1148-1822(+)
MQTEAETLRALSRDPGHPSSIVDILGCGFTLVGTHYALMLPDCGDDLHKFLAAHADMTMFELLSILHQLSNALAFLDAKEICNSDIKLKNIMVVRLNNGDIMVYVVDFGGAVKYRSRINSWTRGYMEEELVEILAAGQAVLADKHVDMYSFGVVIKHIVTRLPPQANYEDLEWGANEEEIYHVKSFFKKTYDALVNKKPRAERTLLASKLAKTFFNLKKLERIF